MFNREPRKTVAGRIFNAQQVIRGSQPPPETRMSTLHRTAFLLLALAASATTYAQSDDHPKAAPDERAHQMRERMAERFKAADTNHDGKLTLEEARAGMPMLAKNFDQVDTARTGSVTLEQVMEAMKKMRQGRREQQQ